MRSRSAPLLIILLAALPLSMAQTCRPLDPVVTEVVYGDFVLRVWRNDDVVRTGRTEAEYQYLGELENTGAEDATAVIAYVTSRSSGTTVVDPLLVFGDVPAGATVASQDTYTISQDRTQPYDPTLVDFQVAEGAMPPMLDYAGTVGSAGGMVDAKLGRVVLEFPPGAVADDTDIRVSSLANVGYPGVIPEFAYDLGPDGTSFGEDVTLTLTYDDSDFPVELDEEDLFVTTISHTTGDLVPLASSVDADANTITAPVSGFSTFMIAISCIPGQPIPPYCPPACTDPPPAFPDDPGGEVDTTFGTDGYLSFELGGAGTTDVQDLLIDDQGRLLIGASALRMAVIRVLPDGEGLDPTFGTDGVALAYTQSDSLALSMALRSDGRIVLHGVRQPAGGGLDLLLARFLPDGVLDPSFGGGDGIVLDLRQGVTGVGQVATLPDGRIFVADAGARSLYQFLEDGSPDPSFGTDGISTDPRFVARRVLRRASGDWLLSIAATARLVDAAGDFVQTFPSNGTGGTAGGFVELPGGRYISGGTTAALIGDPTDIWVARIQTGDDPGSLEGDDCFGTLGSTIIDLAEREAGADVAVQADGRIVVVGTVAGVSQDEVIVLRLRPDGQLDAGFGVDGVVRLDFGGQDQANSVAIDDQGRIVVVGSSYTGDPLFGDRVGVVTRVLP